MITVVETWQLKPQFTHRALEVMQRMEEIIGPAAYNIPGWMEHARFYQSKSDQAQVRSIYSWRDPHSHAKLVAMGKIMLQEFVERYCLREKSIEYYSELPVDVEVGVRKSEWSLG